MTANFGLMLGALLLCLVLSAFFSAAETAFATVNRIRLKAMAGEGNEKAALVLRLLDDYDRLLTTLLLYRSGFYVGKYISLEAKIAKNKDLYYDV